MEKDGKYLMVEEGHKFGKGLWNQPAGGLDKMETIVEAAKRECREETGYNVEITGLLAIQNIHKIEYHDYHSPQQHIVKIAFAAKAVGDPGELDPEDSIADVQWLSKEEIIDLDKKLRDQAIPELIERLEKGQIYPLEIINEVKQ